MFQGKTHEQLTALSDFHARHYDAALGRWHAADPADQFASPYTGMANNPVIATDPDGRLAWFVPIIVGAVIGGTLGGIKAAGNPDMTVGGDIWRGALVGAVGGAMSIDRQIPQNKNLPSDCRKRRMGSILIQLQKSRDV